MDKDELRTQLERVWDELKVQEGNVGHWATQYGCNPEKVKDQNGRPYLLDIALGQASLLNSYVLLEVTDD